MHRSAISIALSGRPPYTYSLPSIYRVREPQGIGFAGSLATASSQRRRELENDTSRSWAWYRSAAPENTNPASASLPRRRKSRKPSAPNATKAETLRTIHPADQLSRKSTRRSIDIPRISGQSHSATYLKNSPAWATALIAQGKSAIACPKTPSIWVATTAKSGSYTSPINDLWRSVTKMAAGAHADR